MPPPPQKIAGLMKGFLRDIDGLHNVLIPMHKHPRFDFHGLFFEVPNYPLDKGAPSSSERIFCPWNFHLRFGHFSRFSGTFFVILFELDLVLVTNFQQGFSLFISKNPGLFIRPFKGETPCTTIVGTHLVQISFLSEIRPTFPASEQSLFFDLFFDLKELLRRFDWMSRDVFWIGITPLETVAQHLQKWHPQRKPDRLPNINCQGRRVSFEDVVRGHPFLNQLFVLVFLLGGSSHNPSQGTQVLG